jgi:hypothetical protein
MRDQVIHTYTANDGKNDQYKYKIPNAGTIHKIKV